MEPCVQERNNLHEAVSLGFGVCVAGDWGHVASITPYLRSVTQDAPLPQIVGCHLVSRQPLSSEKLVMHKDHPHSRYPVKLASTHRTTTLHRHVRGSCPLEGVSHEADNHTQLRSD